MSVSTKSFTYFRKLDTGLQKYSIVNDTTPERNILLNLLVCIRDLTLTSRLSTRIPVTELLYILDIGFQSFLKFKIVLLYT